MHQKSATPSKLKQDSFEIWLRKSIQRPQLFFDPFLRFSLDSLIRAKSRHYQFDWVCDAQQEHRSLALRMLELLAVEYVKTSVDKEHKFRKIKSMQHVLVALQIWF